MSYSPEFTVGGAKPAPAPPPAKKNNGSINAQINSEMAEWAKAGMPVTNKNAFRQARRAEIESGTRASLTPNEAKKSFANATRRTAGEAALGAGISVAAPVAVLAATGGGGVHTAARAAVRASGKGTSGNGARWAQQAAQRIAERSRKSKQIYNALNKARQGKFNPSNLGNILSKAPRPVQNTLRHALNTGQQRWINQAINGLTSFGYIPK